ncbi:MAG: ATP-dependent helicase [Eubacteriales bacterium]
MSYQEFQKKYHIQLNEQQEKAVQTIQGKVLLLAVPGSGKTTVLVKRLGYMIYDQGISPEKILTVTYTVAATNDMKQRFEEVFGGEYKNQLEFRTINGLSQKILNHYGNLIGKKPFSIINNSMKNRIIKGIFQQEVGTFPTELDVKNIELAITYTKNMRFSKEEMEEFDWEVEEFSTIFRRYQEELRSRQLMDYDDQMVYALLFLEKSPEVLEHFQNQYHYICVDEAQDTSKLQHDMIGLLASRWKNLFMVGDEDQSIYGFRAAYPEALVDFEREHTGATVLLMESNYRSCEEIVKIADEFIQQNEKRHKKRIRSTRSKGGIVKQIELRTRQAQHSYLLKVATDIQVETAVLYRNNESALPLIDQLERNGIAYRMKSNEMTFFTHPIVTDISAYIRLALEPTHVESFLRIYYKLGMGISKIMANTIVHSHNGKTSLMEDLQKLVGIPDYLRSRCKSMNTHFQKIREGNAGDTVFRILHNMGYLEYIDDHGMDSSKTAIMQMLANQEERLEDFLPRLDYLKELITNGKRNEDTNMILSTIHSSKGLEYDTVYLLDMVEGTLPSISQPYGEDVNSDNIALYEEERRLYYVAITRAKNRLYIFTYEGNLTSAFSKFIFRKEKPVIKKEKIISNDKLLQQLLEYEEGVVVSHIKYGEGAVVGREGNTAEIFFYSLGESKVIALEFAIVKGIIQIEDS